MEENNNGQLKYLTTENKRKSSGSAAAKIEDK